MSDTGLNSMLSFSYPTSDSIQRHCSRGFSVAKARPLFFGHSQPVLPGRFGFYDLRNDKTILEQLDYASEIGVNAFCYWHYWFAGKRLLNGPLDRMIALPDRGVKFILGWANETWTGIWHGLPNQVIQEQTYSRDELHDHAKLIARYINSDKYLKIGALSPFLIYKPKQIPVVNDYLHELREYVRKFGGGDLYIIGNWGPGRREQISKPGDYGLNAVVANNLGRYFANDKMQIAYTSFWHIAKKLGFGPQIQNYGSTMDTLASAFRTVDGIVHASVITGWDNTPRSGRRGLVLIGYNKQSFSKAVSLAMQLESNNNNQILFLKSWNEWAEGNTIEPKFNEEWSAGSVLANALTSRS